MELDSKLIKYMENRAVVIKMIASALCVQCFVLAVLFCLYGLVGSRLVNDNNIDTVKTVVICISVALSIVLVVFNVQVCIKSNFVDNTYDIDDIAVRQSYEVTRKAYMIARPVLVYQMTTGFAVMVLSGLVYIILMMAMDRSFIAGVYSRVIVTLAIAFTIYKCLPAVDRINAYRRALNEVHRSSNTDRSVWTRLSYALAILLPLSICAWYVMRFYTEKYEIAWIVFPMTILFGTAVVYLIGYVGDNRET